MELAVILQDPQDKIKNYEKSITFNCRRRQ